jgi:hypothetical protein
MAKVKNLRIALFLAGIFVGSLIGGVLKIVLWELEKKYDWFDLNSNILVDFLLLLIGILISSILVELIYFNLHWLTKREIILFTFPFIFSLSFVFSIFCREGSMKDLKAGMFLLFGILLGIYFWVLFLKKK